jgi:hypothetical protein
VDEILIVADTELLLQDDTELLIETLPGTAELVETSTQGPPGPPGSALAQAIAAASVNGHRAITFDEGGGVRHADCTDPLDGYVFGISLNAAATGENVDVRLMGTLEHLGWSFTPEAQVYLGLDGAITQTVPVSAVFIKPLGYALTPTRILLALQPAIHL